MAPTTMVDLSERMYREANFHSLRGESPRVQSREILTAWKRFFHRRNIRTTLSISSLEIFVNFRFSFSNNFERRLSSSSLSRNQKPRLSVNLVLSLFPLAYFFLQKQNTLYSPATPKTSLYRVLHHSLLINLHRHRKIRRTSLSVSRLKSFATARSFEHLPLPLPPPRLRIPSERKTPKLPFSRSRTLPREKAANHPPRSLSSSTRLLLSSLSLTIRPCPSQSDDYNDDDAKKVLTFRRRHFHRRFHRPPFFSPIDEARRAIRSPRKGTTTTTTTTTTTRRPLYPPPLSSLVSSSSSSSSFASARKM